MPGQIPREFIDEVLNRVDVVELIDQSVPLKKRGKNFQACCPFHNEKTPSFNVSPTKQFYHCYGCGANGNAISFMMDYLHMGFIEALENLAGRAGLTLPKRTEAQQQRQAKNNDYYDLMKDIADHYQQQWRSHDQAQTAIDYMKERGISGEIAKRYQLGFAPPGWDFLAQRRSQQAALLATGMLVKNDNARIYDRYRNRIMFPIHDRRGRVIAFGGRVINPEDTPKYLNSPETPIFHKSRELYGLYQVLQQQHTPESIIVVEGYVDVISLAQFGIDNAVATLGTSTTAEHIQALSRYTNTIIFCFDGDKAGKTAAWRALEHCLSQLSDELDIRFLFLPEGDDPDDVVRREGQAGFRKHLQQAKPLVDVMLNKLEDDVDLSTISGRTRLIDLAKPLIKQITAQGYRHFTLESLGQRVRIDPDRLQMMLFSEQKRRTVRHQQRQHLLSPETLALCLVLQQPNLAEKVAKLEISTKLKSDIHAVLQEVLDLLEKKPNLSTAAVVEHWRDTSQFQLIKELATCEHYVPEVGIEAEFCGAMAKVNQQLIEREIAALLQRAHHGDMSTDERQRLQTLIQRLKTPVS